MATQLAKSTFLMRPPVAGDIVFVNLSNGNSISMTATASPSPAVGEFYDGVSNSLTLTQIAQGMAESLIQITSFNPSFGPIFVLGTEAANGALAGASTAVQLEITSLDPSITSVTTDATLPTGGSFGHTPSTVDQSTLGIDTDKKMFVRSPYLLDVVSPTGDQITSASVDIYVYDGTRFTDRPSEPSYRITSAALTSGSTSASFNISEYAKDYFVDAYSFDNSTGVIGSKNYYVDVVPRVTTANGVQSAVPTYLIAHYGYGFVEDGVNPQPTEIALVSGNKLYRLSGSTVYLPINPRKTHLVSGYASNGTTMTQQWNRLQDHTNANLADESISEITYIEVLPTTNFLSAFILPVGFSQYEIVDIDECKYNPIELFFVNRFGAVQNLWFFKNSTERLDVKGEQFRRNTISNSSYSPTDHQYKTLFKEGKRSITLNSGFYPESHNEVFEQLMLSEDCWMRKDGVFTAINIKSQNMKFQTSLKERLISYTIEADIAFDRIQNIT